MRRLPGSSRPAETLCGGGGVRGGSLDSKLKVLIANNSTKVQGKSAPNSFRFQRSYAVTRDGFWDTKICACQGTETMVPLVPGSGSNKPAAPSGASIKDNGTQDTTKTSGPPRLSEASCCSSGHFS